MIAWLLLRWAALSVGVALAAWIVPGVDVNGGFWTVLWVALLFGVVNATLGLLLQLLALPLTILTFGLFALVVNGAVLAIVAWLSDSIDVGGFLGAVVAAFIISAVSLLLTWFVGGRRTAEVEI